MDNYNRSYYYYNGNQMNNQSSNYNLLGPTVELIPQPIIPQPFPLQLVPQYFDPNMNMNYFQNTNTVNNVKNNNNSNSNSNNYEKEKRENNQSRHSDTKLELKKTTSTVIQSKKTDMDVLSMYKRKPPTIYNQNKQDNYDADANNNAQNGSNFKIYKAVPRSGIRKPKYQIYKIEPPANQSESESEREAEYAEPEPEIPNSRRSTQRLYPTEDEFYQDLVSRRESYPRQNSNNNNRLSTRTEYNKHQSRSQIIRSSKVGKIQLYPLPMNDQYVPRQYMDEIRVRANETRPGPNIDREPTPARPETDQFGSVSLPLIATSTEKGSVKPVIRERTPEKFELPVLTKRSSISQTPSEELYPTSSFVLPKTSSRKVNNKTMKSIDKSISSYRFI